MLAWQHDGTLVTLEAVSLKCDPFLVLSRFIAGVVFQHSKPSMQPLVAFWVVWDSQALPLLNGHWCAVLCVADMFASA
jgi:hypothetical protein